MLEILSYVIEFVVETAFLFVALWVMIKIQKLDYKFLALLGTAALGSALDMIPLAGHYLAVPVLYICITKLTNADMFPDAVFTVAIAYALTFGMNLFLLGALLGDLRPSARESLDDEDDRSVEIVGTEVSSDSSAPVPVAVSVTSNAPTSVAATLPVAKTNSANSLAPAATATTKTKTAGQLSEGTLKSFTLKGVNAGTRPLAIVSDGKKNFTLGVGESQTVQTSDGAVTVRCEQVNNSQVILDVSGQKVRLSLL